MFVTIINDCRDDNAAARQTARAQTLFGRTPSFIGVANDLEAAGNLIDVLDAANGAEGAIIANVAPRQGAARKWENGTPFGYFRVGKTLVAASAGGRMLSLAKKLGLLSSFFVWNTTEAALRLEEKGILGHGYGIRAAKSQFRSYDFLPFAARFTLDGGELPGEPMDVGMIDEVAPAVWWVDSFGNCKTSAFPGDLGFEAGKTVALSFGSLPCVAQLRDVPDGEAALILGSSGYGTDRFLEIVVQGGSAAEKFGIRSGQSIKSI